MHGELAVRVERFKLATHDNGVPTFKKGFFEAAWGVARVDGTFEVAFRIPDWSLNDSKGELYAASPTRPLIERRDDGLYEPVKDADGKTRYMSTFFWPKGATLDVKTKLNAAAIAAYEAAKAEAEAAVPAGVGARVTEGQERGLPGSLLDSDELPF